jgi:ribosomal protein S18 acetylase RimI-like enzyme
VDEPTSIEQSASGDKNGLVIRAGRAEDTKRIADLVSGEPGQEAVAIAGSFRQARDFGMGLVRMPHSPQGWQVSTLAEVDSGVVGVIQTGHADFSLTPRLLWLAIRTFGLSLITVLPRARARRRVEPDVPASDYHISEFDVDPQFRNRRIGGRLLDHVEAEARAQGYTRMSLVTTTINPARRLYERHGFAVVETLTDPDYERITGISGRHFMVKELR